MKKATFLGMALAAGLGATATLVAQQAQEASSAPMDNMMELMQPGAKHAKLEPLVGNFTMQGRWRMDADAEWQEIDGAEIEREWILDGRFVQERVQAEFMGSPFEGMGLIGYDNLREEYTMVWVESMATGIWTSTGQLEGNTIVFEGRNSDAMSGQKEKWTRSVIDLSDAELTYKGYAKDRKGNEYLTAEMRSTRR